MKIVVPYKHKKIKNFQSINTLFSQEKLPTYTTAGCSQIRPPRLVLEVGGGLHHKFGEAQSGCTQLYIQLVKLEVVIFPVSCVL